MDQNCIFCNIAAGEMGATPLYQDDHVTAFRDINPKAPVHILVIPNKHITYISDAGEEDRDLLGRMMLAATDLAKKEGIDEKGYRLVMNNGENAGQSVFHIHLHLLGGRYMSWPPG